MCLVPCVSLYASVPVCLSACLPVCLSVCLPASYVAPEYAMTGHLVVQSDVYSFGVILLELLTGRRPVDMSQPAGQENLVTWVRGERGGG